MFITKLKLTWKLFWKHFFAWKLCCTHEVYLFLQYAKYNKTKIDLDQHKLLCLAGSSNVVLIIWYVSSQTFLSVSLRLSITVCYWQWFDILWHCVLVTEWSGYSLKDTCGSWCEQPRPIKMHEWYEKKSVHGLNWKVNLYLKSMLFVYSSFTGGS